ncbi:FecR family protein [Pedobacter sp. MC2016-24]|uniref:FecR family protein n=1 Tax=Pedobacter sp. MC2016-24 TaxID=2780090 RepID=UPI0018810A30|nr:FecR family protein [Pedobacter sp. MC2016-24]MBE9599379.1 FecR domain-containing protein [Pedobacter sp. MC2016-24]
MEEQRLIYLYQQHKARQLSSVEEQEWQTALAEDSNLLLQTVGADWDRLNADEYVKVNAESSKNTLKYILSQPQLKPAVKLWPKIAVAATLIFSMASAAYFYIGRQSILSNSVAFDQVIKPGKNRATLTLADGKEISLNDAANGDLIKQAGLSISKTAEGQLVYNVENVDNITDDSKMNTISTPNGGEWQIRLPDGSTVWLNAASSLVYPLNIGVAKTRKVKLRGEAYFEVAKNAAHPFIVETEKQMLEVLGTHFNVNSYADEQITRTTLLEGSIRVADAKNLSATEVLKPGEQAVLSANGIKVSTVDTDESVAWKNGYFKFNNEKQESIMRKISRWYNIQVEYADQEAKNVVYYGTMSRFEKISQVLQKFEQTGEVSFDLKGNKLIVYKE